VHILSRKKKWGFSMLWIKDGKKYVRVSDVLRPLKDFSGIPEAILEKKREIGQDIHKAIDEDINGTFPIIFPNTTGYFESYDKWVHEIKPNFVETEARYYDDEKMVTGCVDALALMPGDSLPVLLDWKTSASEDPVVWPLQAHLYYYLIASHNRKVAKRFLFVKLSRNGELPKVYQYQYDSNLMAHAMELIDKFWTTYDSPVDKI